MRGYQQTQVFYIGQHHVHKHVSRYFTCRRYPAGALWLIFISGILAIYLATRSYGWLATVCAAVFFMTGIIILLRVRSIPTLGQYDAWLQVTEDELDRHSRKRHSNQYNKVLPKGSCIRSVVLPNSKLASFYSAKKVLWNKEKGSPRLSFIVFTFYYLTESYIAVYTYRVNAFNQFEAISEKVRAFSYNHIADITTSINRDSAQFDNQDYMYNAERFLLRLIHEDIQIGAYINAEPGGKNSEQAPKIYMNAEPVIDKLYHKMITKWG